MSNPKSENKLSRKQERFCIEYMKDSNGKKSAIRAGYAPKNAEITASKNLRLAKVKDHLREMVSKIEDEAILTFKQIQIMLSDKAREELNTDGIRAVDLLNKMQGNYEKNNEQLKPNTVTDIKIVFVDM